MILIIIFPFGIFPLNRGSELQKLFNWYQTAFVTCIMTITVKSVQSRFRMKDYAYSE